jgi:hypothetical protein
LRRQKFAGEEFAARRITIRAAVSDALAKPFRRFSCRTRDASGLSGCLAGICDLSRCWFVQFDRGAHLL